MLKCMSHSKSDFANKNIQCLVKTISGWDRQYGSYDPQGSSVWVITALFQFFCNNSKTMSSLPPIFLYVVQFLISIILCPIDQVRKTCGWSSKSSLNVKIVNLV